MEIIMIALVTISAYLYFKSWYLEKKLENYLNQTE